jgi:signal transduction histidine kinase
VTAVEDGPDVLVSVRDHGPGIADIDLASVFGRFARLDEPGQPQRYAGHGLGLYITRRLVEDQHGTVSVANAPGGGAVFSYTLPTVAWVDAGTA